VILGGQTADLVHQVKIASKNVFLYSQVLYSRHERGRAFWRETLRRTSAKMDFDRATASAATVA